MTVNLEAYKISSVGNPDDRSASYPRVTLVTYDVGRADGRRKVNLLLASCILSSSISLLAVGMAFLEVASVIRIAHPLFWFPMSFGAFGVAGSTYIYLRRLWIAKPQISSRNS